MINLSDISIQLGTKLLFHSVNLCLKSGQRFGITGANGAGKSTLLKMLAGTDAPSTGTIEIPKRTTIGWLKQDQFKYNDEIIVNVVIRGKEELWDALQEKEQILKNSDICEQKGMRLSELEEIICSNNGYEAESRAEKLLLGLGIHQDMHYETLSMLSGGYKLRVLLAQSLFEDPDILLLDEPTNHLDIMTSSWLEQYLISEFKGILLLVSHDVYFLNKVSTAILDIDYGDIRLYPGNYDKFLKQKELYMEQKLSKKKNVEAQIANLQKYIDRFGAKASKARQAASKEKMIERLEIPDIEHSSRIIPNFSFNIKENSGKNVLKVREIHKSFGDKKVLTNVSFSMFRQDKIAFVGHNGIGKSTLLKILNEKIEASSGVFEWGHKVSISYVAQDHHEALNKSQSALEWLSEQTSNISEVQIRKIMGRALFTKDDVHKNVLNLSGGECARLLLAKCMLEESNVLILDEPTNHLDIESITGLTAALKNYKGTLLIVSHDRAFVSNVATRIIALTENGLTDVVGDYQNFLNNYGMDYLQQSWLVKNS